MTGKLPSGVDFRSHWFICKVICECIVPEGFPTTLNQNTAHFIMGFR